MNTFVSSTSKCCHGSLCCTVRFSCSLPCRLMSAQSLTASKRKGMPPSPGVWPVGACWPFSCPGSWTTGRPETHTHTHTCAVLSLSISTWLKKPHTTFPGTLKEWQRKGGETFPFHGFVCEDDEAVRHFRCQLSDTWPLIHDGGGRDDSSPVSPLFSKLKTLCTLLTMYSVTLYSGRETGRC